MFETRNRFRRRLSQALSCCAIVALFLGCAIWANWQRDSAILKTQALQIVAGVTKPSDRIAAINHWVYANQGFAKNEDYFLVKSFGPTSVQVMEHGGDCSDKSRLVSALLAQLGISSWLVMIAECHDCTPIHTVVEAQNETGRMVVDPIWDIVYADPAGRYLSLDDLADPAVAWQRVLALKKERGPNSKITAMDKSEATFAYAKSINWDKNRLTRTVLMSLELIGVKSQSVHRPAILEDPELLIADSCFLLALGILALGLIVRVMPRYNHRRRLS